MEFVLVMILGIVMGSLHLLFVATSSRATNSEVGVEDLNGECDDICMKCSLHIVD